MHAYLKTCHRAIRTRLRQSVWEVQKSWSLLSFKLNKAYWNETKRTKNCGPRWGFIDPPALSVDSGVSSRSQRSMVDCTFVRTTMTPRRRQLWISGLSMECVSHYEKSYGYGSKLWSRNFWDDYHPTLVFFVDLLGCSPGLRGFWPTPRLWTTMNYRTTYENIKHGMSSRRSKGLDLRWFRAMLLVPLRFCLTLGGRFGFASKKEL